MKKIIAVIVLSLFLIGCGITKANVNPGMAHPAKDPAQVSIFYEKPSQPYTEIAIVDSLSYLTLGDAINRIRAKAASLGADAVIIKDTGSGYGYVTAIGSAIVFQR